MTEGASAKNVLAAAIALAIALPALAQEAPPVPPPGVVLSDQDRQAWAQMTAFFDQCIGATVLQADVGACRIIRTYLAAFATRVAVTPKEK